MHLFSLVRREFIVAFYWFAFLNDFKTTPGAKCGNPSKITENESTAVVPREAEKKLSVWKAHF